MGLGDAVACALALVLLPAVALADVDADADAEVDAFADAEGFALSEAFAEGLAIGPETTVKRRIDWRADSAAADCAFFASSPAAAEPFPPDDEPRAP